MRVPSLPLPRPRRRRRNRSLKTLAPAPAPPPPPPPPPGILVLSATRVSEFFIQFSFSAAVTSIGGAGNAQIVIETALGAETPSAASQVDAMTVRFQYDSGIASSGNAWEILAAPEGLDFHGETFVVPQGGVVG